MTCEGSRLCRTVERTEQLVERRLLLLRKLGDVDAFERRRVDRAVRARAIHGVDRAGVVARLLFTARSERDQHGEVQRKDSL
jgi:hypothetical protein